ncbi:hypothetical protein [Candidatus Tisiphia endosymbiont of Mystacides longicornis]|uniref:hypothetical protein n=1 Tax=Candidatus Tisiphia endosymbiont of Mystacides longicornis TaxID=3139330 RepID=UPI003CCAD734
MQIPSITIEQVAQQFKAWRQTKTNKFDPIPNHLKELVHQLLHHYSYQEIAKHLNINKATISSTKKAHEPTIKTSSVSTSNQSLQQNINFLVYLQQNCITLSNFFVSMNFLYIWVSYYANTIDYY